MANINQRRGEFNSFLLLQGLETLSLRVEKHLANTKTIVDFLNNYPLVSWVNYPSLPTNKYYHLAQKYLPKGAGSIFTFGIKGGVAAAKSLVIHPASTTHQQLSEAEQKAAGLTLDMIRLSIGIEDADDLIYDLDQALQKTVSV